MLWYGRQICYFNCKANTLQIVISYLLNTFNWDFKPVFVFEYCVVAHGQSYQNDEAVTND